MQLTNRQVLPVGQADTWEALNDMTLLQQCIPGCESMTLIATNAYEVTISAAVGPVRARFRGKLALEDIEPQSAYGLRFEGQGGAAGHGKGTAKVRLEPAGPDRTVLHYAVTASVGGKLAQIGSRLVDLAAQKMADDFFTAFNEAIRDKYGARAATLDAASATQAPLSTGSPASGWWKRLGLWIASLFSKRSP